jgi:hypothetical protein
MLILVKDAFMIVSSIIRKKTASNTSRGGRDPLRVDQIVLEVVRENSSVRLLAFDPKLGALE